MTEETAALMQQRKELMSEHRAEIDRFKAEIQALKNGLRKTVEQLLTPFVSP